jgi:hypothetical protein
MAKAETWHPLKPEDARNLTAMLAQFNSRSPSGQKRMHMTLYLWSRLWDERDGTPYFSCSERTIAKECGVSYKTARTFMASMEDDGWIVRLECHKKGKCIRRTFAWLMDESAPQKGRTLRPNYLQKGRSSAPLDNEKRAHINMEHVNRAVDTMTAPVSADGVADNVLVNSATGEPYEPERVDPYEIRIPEWMREQ